MGRRHAVKYLLVGAMVSLCLVVIFNRTSSWHNYIEYIDQLRKVNYRMKNVTSNLPYIYVITPTYTRLVQKAELTRLSQTLRLVPNLHWILVEDSNETTKLVTNLLMQSHLPYTHLAITETKKDTTKRGVFQRNAGLTWLRANNKTNGVVYFADDDNTYDVRLFEEMRFTKKVAVWPVGLITQLRAEGCIVNNGKVSLKKRTHYFGNGPLQKCVVVRLLTMGGSRERGGRGSGAPWEITSRYRFPEKFWYQPPSREVNTALYEVTGWFATWAPNRKYAIDMAGFAVNLRLIQEKPDVYFGGTSGYLETEFLSKISVDIHDLEPKADNCTKVLVWHTKTIQANSNQENATLTKYGLNSSLFQEV